jgi:hypothetical protein
MAHLLHYLFLMYGIMATNQQRFSSKKLLMSRKILPFTDYRRYQASKISQPLPAVNESPATFRER